MDSGMTGCLVNTLAVLLTAVIVIAGCSLFFRIFICFIPVIVTVLFWGIVIYLVCRIAARLSR